MLFKCFFKFMCMTGLLKLGNSQEGNGQGLDTALGTKFLVYFVEYSASKKEDGSWLCGGAVVSPTQILTAAACLVQAEKIYAIAGYKKYIDAKDIENDQCTKVRKQRVVRILIPREYTLPPKQRVPTINVDVGVAIVEKPYNFSDLTYRVYCSYEPQQIIVNYDEKYQMESTRAIAFGWGNINKQSQGDVRSQLLQEAPTVIVNKKICSSAVNTQEVLNTIEKYLLCASSNISNELKDMNVTQAIKYCNFGHTDLTKATDNHDCIENNSELRKNGYLNTNSTDDDKDISEKVQANSTEIKNETNVESQSDSKVNSQRISSNFGSCQNLYGYPMIKLVGNKTTVIGVSSNANSSKDCMGPFLYVSTAATSKIIKCLLETNPVTRKLCNEEISDKRNEVQEIEIIWSSQLNKPRVPAMTNIRRRGLEHLPMYPPQTRRTDIVFGSNQKHDVKAYDPEVNEDLYKNRRSQPYDQNGEAPYNGNEQSSNDEQPSVQNLKLTDRRVKHLYPSPVEQIAEDPLMKQQNTQPLQQYEPPMEQQYEIPHEQYDRPDHHEHGQGLPPSQQYDLVQRKELERQPNPTKPGHEYFPPAGQVYDQRYDTGISRPYQPPTSKEYASQSVNQGQQYEQSVRQHYKAAPGSQYGTHPGEENKHVQNSPPQTTRQQMDQEYETSKEQQYNKAQRLPQHLQISKGPQVQTNILKQQLHFDKTSRQDLSQNINSWTTQKSASLELVFSELLELQKNVPSTPRKFGHEEIFEQIRGDDHEPYFDRPHDSGRPDERYEENHRNKQSEQGSGSLVPPKLNDGVAIRPQIPIY